MRLIASAPPQDTAAGLSLTTVFPAQHAEAIDRHVHHARHVRNPPPSRCEPQPLGYSGHDCVKSFLSSYTGLCPQKPRMVGLLGKPCEPLFFFRTRSLLELASLAFDLKCLFKPRVEGCVHHARHVRNPPPSRCEPQPRITSFLEAASFGSRRSFISSPLWTL